jgi:hypothetical protein
MNVSALTASAVAIFFASCATDPSKLPHATNATVTTELNRKLSKRVPMQSFSLQDSVVSMVDFQWPDPTHPGGEHRVEWRWYKDGTLVSQSEKRLTFTSTPYTTWTTRAAGSLGIGHFRVDTLLDGVVASSSEFDIHP